MQISKKMGTVSLIITSNEKLCKIRRSDWAAWPQHVLREVNSFFVATVA
jgi:hypothetical protein